MLFEQLNEIATTKGLKTLSKDEQTALTQSALALHQHNEAEKQAAKSRRTR
jgi:hypothetical protein